jgi:hypothetical protein
MKFPRKPGAKSRSGLFSSASTFIDLFAGIGGMCLAFESAGGQCVFTSEYSRDSNAPGDWESCSRISGAWA